MKNYHDTVIGISLILLSLIFLSLIHFQIFPVSFWTKEALLKSKREEIKQVKTIKPIQQNLEEYAIRLRKEHDSVHIYAVSNKFEVWCMHGIVTGKWKDAETMEEARKIVNEYYIEWARNCIGPNPPGKLIE